MGSTVIQNVDIARNNTITDEYFVLSVAVVIYVVVTKVTVIILMMTIETAFFFNIDIRN